MANVIPKRPKTGGRLPGSINKTTAEMRALAQQHGGSAIETLVVVMNTAKSESVRLAAANSLLDRAYGKPSQPVEVEPSSQPDTCGWTRADICAHYGYSDEQYEQILKIAQEKY